MRKMPPTLSPAGRGASTPVGADTAPSSSAIDPGGGGVGTFCNERLRKQSVGQEIGSNGRGMCRLSVPLAHKRQPLYTLPRTPKPAVCLAPIDSLLPPRQVAWPATQSLFPLGSPRGHSGLLSKVSFLYFVFWSLKSPGTNSHLQVRSLIF